MSETAKAARNTLLVVSIPASESPHQKAERGVADIEVGGERGREALARLKNAIGRVEASWRPASPDEGFEIVRRRLFQSLTGDQFVTRDAVARAFVDLYGSQQPEFPSECREADYERRIKMAYPIHPELFDRLFNDWSTLDKFQRTRGVLRLMAAVIHSLWERQDSSVLILGAKLQPFWIYVEPRPATTRTVLSFSPATRTDSASWSRPSANTSPGHLFGMIGLP